MASTKILVVNDEPEFCLLAKRALEAMRYEVAIAYGVGEALAKIHNFNPILAVLDVMMPRLTGNEIVKMIKTWKPELQIIMVSAVAKQEIKEDCIAGGAYDCLDKPVNFGLLNRKIQEAINSGKEQRIPENGCLPKPKSPKLFSEYASCYRYGP